MSADTFDARRAGHDGSAIAAVEQILASVGYDLLGPFGAETAIEQVRKGVRAQRDPTSQLLRYRPDHVFARRGDRTLLVELKTDLKGYPNFSVEAESYLAGREWNKSYRHVACVFADGRSGPSGRTWECWGCWADDVPCPVDVSVPTFHPDAAAAVRHLQVALPNTALHLVDWGAGSGTPFFLIPKPRTPDGPLRPLLAFAREQLVGVPPLVLTPAPAKPARRRPGVSASLASQPRLPLDGAGM